MIQENSFLGKLPSVAGYSISGNRLTLLDSAGNLLLSFRVQG
jgi:heat shock protein HslJ